MTKKKTFWTMVRQFLLYFVVGQGSLVVGVVCAALFNGIVHKGMDKEEFLTSVTSSNILPWSMIIGNALLIAIFLGARLFKLRLGRIQRDKIWVTAAHVMLIAWGWMFTEVALMSLTGYDKLFANESDDFLFLANIMSNVLGLIAGGILVPIVEEIVFRGAILGGLLRMRQKPWVAIGLSALVFALCHGTMTQLPGTLIFGLIAGWLFWSTKSLLPGMVFHIVNNSTASVLCMLSDNPNEDLGIKASCLLLLVCVPLLLYGLHWFQQKRYVE